MHIINLCGTDGNAYVVLGLTRHQMALRGDSPEQIKQTMLEATSGDYAHLLSVCEAAVGWTYIGDPRSQKKDSHGP